MEHRKDCAGPREMLDDSMLQRLLNDMAEDKPVRSGSCGCGRETPAGSAARPLGYPEKAGGCGCSANTVQSGGPGCGCREKDSCRSAGKIPPLTGLSLAMVYAPEQGWENIFEPEEALETGTLFAGLVFPWYPSRCRGNKDCGCGRG